MRTNCKSVAFAAAISMLVALACFALLGPRLSAADRPSVQERADRFLDLVNAGYQALSRVQGEAQWDAATDVTPAHDAASEVAGKAYAAFNGNPAIINEAKDLLLHRAELNELTVRQLERALLNASEGPMTNQKLTGDRVAAETAQASVIVPDGLGLGGSSKPSDGLRAKFPKYGYLDMVEAQYKLVTEQLGLQHLRLILGTSMGGMQTWLWGEQHPEFMDALMPIASLPIEVSGRNYLWRRVLTESIRQDPDWRNGDYAEQPSRYRHVLPVFNVMTNNPVHLQELGDTWEKSAQLYDAFVRNDARTIDANNFLYRFEASYDYNPAPDLGKIRAKLYAVNFDDDELNPVALGVLEREIPKIPNAKFVNVPASPNSLGHLSLTQAERWKAYLSELLGSLPQG